MLDLRPDRSLLNPNFDGYKLSLDKVPSFSAALPSKLRSRAASEDQFSFLHAKLFGQSSNLIVADSQDPDRLYLLHPGEGTVSRIIYTEGRAEVLPVNNTLTGH